MTLAEVQTHSFEDSESLIPHRGTQAAMFGRIGASKEALPLPGFSDPGVGLSVSLRL